MKRIYIVILLIMLTGPVSASSAAVLVQYPNGSSATQSDLSTASISADAVGKTIIVTSAITVNNVTIPSTMTLKLEQGGLITVNRGKTLAINGSFHAGQYQVFSGPGSVIFGTGSTPSVEAKWFGSTGAAIQSAINSAAANIKKVNISPGIWMTSSQIVMPTATTQWGIEVTGNKGEDKYQGLPGSWSTVIRASAGLASVVTNASTYYNVWKNIVIDGNNKADVGYINGWQDKLIDSAVIQCRGAGISFGNSTNASIVERVTSALNAEGLNYTSANPSGATIRNCKFRENTGNGITIGSGVQVHFIDTIFESNRGTGTSIIGAADPLISVIFDNCHWENNADYQIYISKTGVIDPAEITFNNPLILSSEANKGVQIRYGSATFKAPLFHGSPLSPGYFNVASTAGIVEIDSTDARLSSGNITIDGTGASKVLKRYTRSTGGFGFNQNLQASVLRTQVNAPATRILTAQEVSGTIITNYGQEAADVVITLPPATEGYSFTAIAATAQPKNAWIFQAANGGSYIYVNGSTLKSSVRLSPATIGASMQCTAFTGTFYGWSCSKLSGSWN